MKASNRIIFNTGVLYFQLIFGMIIGLFTTRIVLDVLGETDYGIYVIVGSIVGMLGILGSNMASTSMRFMAHSLGSNNQDLIIKTFNTTLFLHFIIAFVVVIIMEIGGWIMFKYFIEIPTNRVGVAKIVFQCMVVTTFIAIISVPYDAVINSHEKLLTLSLVDMLASVLRLGLAVALIFCQYDLLIIYGIGMMIIQMLMRIIKQYYSKRKFKECKIDFKRYLDKEKIKEILFFTGWNLFGSLGALALTQIRSVFINMFFGVKLNASEGVARNVSSKVNLLSVSLNKAINPQLMKSEGGGDRKRMLDLTKISAKYSSFLFSLFAVPIFIETPYILDLWLKSVPDYAVIFCRLILITMFIERFSFPITDTIRATGKIRKFQVVETVLVLVINLPLSYYAFKNGFPPFAIYVVGIISSLILFIERSYFGKKIAELHIYDYLSNAVFPVLFSAIISIIPITFFLFYMSSGLVRLSLVFILFIFVFVMAFWLMGLNKGEKDSFLQLFKQVINKIIK